MMKDLKVTLQFRDKFHKESFLNCFTKERLKKSRNLNRGKDFVLHYGITDVSELDGSVHYSNHREINLVTDDERNRLFNELMEVSAEKIKREFLEESRKRYEFAFSSDFLVEAIRKEMGNVFDQSLLELIMKKLQEQD